MDASWIWDHSSGEKGQTTMLFRAEFSIAELGRETPLKISAAHHYQLYLNGNFIGRGPDRSDPRFRYHDTYEVASFLHSGVNLCICVVHHYGEADLEHSRSWNLYDGPGGLFVEMEGVLHSDSKWEFLPAPGWSSPTYSGSRFHPSIHHVNWTVYQSQLQRILKGEKDGHWHKVAVHPVGSHPCFQHSLPSENPPLEETVHRAVTIETICSRASQIKPSPKWLMMGSGTENPVIGPLGDGMGLVFRLEHAMAGVYQMELSCDEECEVDLYCGEAAEHALSDKLCFNGYCLYEPIGWRGGDTVSLWIRKASAPVELISFKFIQRRYPFISTGMFQCDSSVINAVWRASVETARHTVLDHPVDCLWREQALWIEDVVVHGRAMRAAFGNIEPVRKVLRQAFSTMDERGVVPVPGPSGIGYGFDAPELRWSSQPLALSVIARDYFQFTEDRETAQFALDSLERIFGFFNGYRNEHGLLRTDPPGKQSLSVFCGWDTQLREGTPVNLNCCYAIAMDSAADLAVWLGRHESSQRWKKEADALREAIRKCFWDSERHVVVDGEQGGKRLETVSITTNAWAALAGIVRPDISAAWAHALSRTLPEVYPVCSPYDATLLLQAYANLDLDLHFKELLVNYFGSMVAKNLTTFPEFWMESDSSAAGTRGGGSSCHPYGSGPAYLCQDYILGIRPNEPGWRSLTIRPRSLGLSHASGRIFTKQGEVEMNWRKDRQSWRIEISLPKETTASVVLPRLGWGKECMRINGKVIWRAPEWSHYQKLFKRQPLEQNCREISHLVENQGRTVIELNAN